MRACGSRAGNGSVALYHLCAPNRIRHQVSRVSSLLVVTTSFHFSCTTARSTTWTARSSPRRHITPRTTSSKPVPKTSANAIRSKSNAKESLSHPNSHASCALLSFSFGLCSSLTFLSPVSSVVSSCPSCSCSLSSSVSKPGGCSLGLCSPF